MTDNEDTPDVYELAEQSSRSRLHGFWKEDEDTLQPVPKALIEGVRRRAKATLDTYAKLRWMVLEDWDRWQFEAEVLGTTKVNINDRKSL